MTHPHVLRTATEQERSLILGPYSNRRAYYEAWQGLPSLPFQATHSRGGLEAGVCRIEKHYVWVPPNAWSAFQEDPHSIFIAEIKPHHEYTIYAPWISAPREWTAPEAGWKPRGGRPTAENAIEKVTQENFRHTLEILRSKQESIRAHVLAEISRGLQ